MAEYSKVKKWIGNRFGSRIIQLMIGAKTEHRFFALYGDFNFGRSFRKKSIEGLEQESGKVYGAIIYFLESINEQANNVLLAGEDESVKPVYGKILGLELDKIDTAGVMDGMDYHWDFEYSPPMDKQYSCIVSQSMLEHLIDPYKHVKDCVSLLENGGVLIVHTMMPGFDYHRYPVDCFRFYPDWFEEVSKRLGVTVKDKQIRNSRITYMMQKKAVSDG